MEKVGTDKFFDDGKRACNMPIIVKPLIIICSSLFSPMVADRSLLEKVRQCCTTTTFSFESGGTRITVVLATTYAALTMNRLRQQCFQKETILQQFEVS
ncbi:Hypothetical protein PP7435_CHR2-1594 [Komagataella phaffii CBS 7435]|uniref:Uncharacterized protein n=1 Tax=Komagataella phaffii (strain ATCC 76273 / CBS 7435 / CECT 11047 / NRRL Y-11430 / Wegner 21-1) TaxID=981350 RepID=A0A1G4KPQ0_KOMPC|nr:Hypothetical protein BQ9382_C2-1302 [Komagataella phaffii CBS 7435]SCV11989.1 Hypothetical protein PP7435_CHR2-1594 [Komagataella phaffii CBS 7435]